ncbi:MAG: pseudouridine synthase [Sphingobacteriales bacterium]|uniref:pseudouridine synthase n=1 Tax=Hydrotalea flava TaxID=714549 RepID=UPI000836D64F|nr:pseudouridine synthase [Hydrotalea flava]RTL48081.1 MAG: pseudouridine synthase [Sphingobacteriales bacterium]
MAKAFEKFMDSSPKGAKKKEAIRQEKRKAKAASRAEGEAFRKKQWEKKHGIAPEVPASIPPSKNVDKTVRSPKKEERRFSKSSPQSAKQKAIAPVTTVAADPQAPMPLNKFLAHAGICGRREAAELIKAGQVTVNGDTIFEPGFKVLGNEDVKWKGKKIFLQKNLVYILLNKPKDYITTAKDPEGRKTVLDLVKDAAKQRVYPVGRLDRNTTGVLLLTNDGALAQKLTHPSFQVKKIYEVKLDKPVAKKDLEALLTGFHLEDGFIQADSAAYADAKDKSVIGIEIHSGRNRIVRRMFEHLGYDVRGLDRVLFAGLTKKNVDRGTWRFLNEKEIRNLKFMNGAGLAKNDHNTAH